MLFNSLHFFIYFPIVTALYFLSPHKYRWILLLVASCIFYMSFVPQYILILFFLIVVDYSTGIALECLGDEKKRLRRIVFLASIFSNIGTLFIFKYFNFFNSQVAEFFHFFNLQYSIGSLSIILPIGLSFHTFQSLGYVIEVYRGKFKAERHLGIYALYVMFYPQLVAGPVERPANLLPQLKVDHFFQYSAAVSGLRLMLWGLFKKMVVADRLAMAVDQIYANVHAYTGLPLLLAVFAFYFQVYCDFSGYSDIAIGAARVMGFRLSKNFAEPFLSRSAPEFWHRWHISLSSWFRDYFYYPLVYGAKKLTRRHLYVCVILTLLITGIWHGAGWTFAIMGIVQGVFIIVSLASRPLREKIAKASGILQFPRLHRTLQSVYIIFLMSMSWIFLRANSLSDDLYIFKNMFVGLEKIFVFSYIRYFVFIPETIGLTKFQLLIAILAIILLFAVESYNGLTKKLTSKFYSWPGWARWSFYYSLIFAIIFFGVFGKRDFIYFQF